MRRKVAFWLMFCRSAGIGIRHVGEIGRIYQAWTIFLSKQHEQARSTGNRTSNLLGHKSCIGARSIISAEKKKQVAATSEVDRE